MAASTCDSKRCQPRVEDVLYADDHPLFLPLRRFFDVQVSLGENASVKLMPSPVDHMTIRNGGT